MVFKNNKYLTGVKEVHEGIKINCNAGAVVTNLRGSYGRLKVWYLPDRIANNFSMHELERLYRITYDGWDGFYVVHTSRGEVRTHKGKHGLPFIDLDKSDKDAAILLVQLVEARGKRRTMRNTPERGPHLCKQFAGTTRGSQSERYSTLKKQDELKQCLGIQAKRIFRGW
jgi:hypothetical protein